MVVFGFLLPPASGAETKSLTLVYPQEKNVFHEAAAAAIIREAYEKLGIQLIYKTYPAERALRTSNQGRADVELVRIKGIDKKYTNLIRIPVSHVQAEQMAFGKSGGIKINGWESLKPYKIVFHRGYKVAEQNTIGMKRLIVGIDRSAFLMVEKENGCGGGESFYRSKAHRRAEAQKGYHTFPARSGKPAISLSTPQT
ncbi:MAG: hypothetical protein VCE91_11520 [Nitrospinota bacterium]